MGTVILPNTAKTTANANNFADVKDNDQAIIDQVNGSLNATNLASNAVTTTKITDANVTDAKLANPNNSVYKTVAETQFVVAAGTAAGATINYPSENVSTGVGNLIGPSTTTTISPRGIFDYTSTDFTVASLTTKFRVKMEVAVGATSPSTVTLTAGLYPLTLAAGAWTPGTAVVGSTALSSGLSTNAISRFNSGDFSASALLSDPGVYVFGVVVGSITVPTGIQVAFQLQTRNV